MNSNYRKSCFHRDGSGSEVTEYVRTFEEYTIVIVETTNYYGGKTVARLIPKVEESAPDYRRLIAPTIEFFATGANVEEIETAMSACYEATKHIRLKVL